MVSLLIAGLILLTGYLVTIEMALFSVRRERLELAVKKGDRRAQAPLEYLGDPPKYLTASNVALTALSIVIGSFVQPWLTGPIEGLLKVTGLPPAWGPTLAYLLAVAVLTVLTLIAGNLVPKQIGFVRAEDIVLRTSATMRLVVILTRPLSRMVEPIVRLVTWILRVPTEAKAKVAEGDILILMEEGLRAGGIDPREQEIAKRAFALSDLRVEDHMTEREKVSWLDIDLPVDQARAKVAKCGRSWVLVGDGTLDRNLGVVQAREYLSPSSPPDHKRLLAMLKPAPELKVGAPLLSALELLVGAESRIIVVRDGHGRVAGVLTANDIVRALVGPLKSL